jgi:hypothetical protein
MFRTLNKEKANLAKTDLRTVVGTTLFVVLLGAAMFFIAFAGHM